MVVFCSTIDDKTKKMTEWWHVNRTTFKARHLWQQQEEDDALQRVRVTDLDEPTKQLVRDVCSVYTHGPYHRVFGCKEPSSFLWVTCTTHTITDEHRRSLDVVVVDVSVMTSREPTNRTKLMRFLLTKGDDDLRSLKLGSPNSDGMKVSIRTLSDHIDAKSVAMVCTPLFVFGRMVSVTHAQSTEILWYVRPSNQHLSGYILLFPSQEWFLSVDDQIRKPLFPYIMDIVKQKSGDNNMGWIRNALWGRLSEEAEDQRRQTRILYTHFTSTRRYVHDNNGVVFASLWLESRERLEWKTLMRLVVATDDTTKDQHDMYLPQRKNNLDTLYCLIERETNTKKRKRRT